MIKKKLTPKQRIIEYLMITGFVWGMYLIWLIPFQYYRVGLTDAQLIHWLLEGTAYEMVFTYPIVKISIKYGPKITEWVKNNI